MTVRVRLLGRPVVEDAEQPRPQPRGKKSWALLARLALGDRPLARSELAAELFCDADDPLGALRWGLADLRRSLGIPGALRGDPLTLSPEEAWVDVWALEEGLLPVADMEGVLLDGVDLRGCPAFDLWLLLARARSAIRAREEIRAAALDLLSRGEAEQAVEIAHQGAMLDPLDEDAQELFVRALVAAGREGQASVHLASCLDAFARSGVEPSPALRAAGTGTKERRRSGVRASAVAASLIRAGSAALAAGAPDAGVDTLRRAVEEAERARDSILLVDALGALGRALVHAVRGYDGEGAVVLNRALGLVRSQQRPDVLGELLRELAFVDVQAGRHASAARALQEALGQADQCGDGALRAGVLALQGMNTADRGRHLAAADLLRASAEAAAGAGQRRQESWSLGVLSRSLLLSGQPDAARVAAESSIDLADQERWNAFLPWPQVFRAQVLAEQGDGGAARKEAESAFALACELGDPCWEGMAARALALFAGQRGESDAARDWIQEARRRSDRVADRYVWVSTYIGLADLELQVGDGAGEAAAASRLYDDALRADLPELLAWALVHQVEAGDTRRAGLARATAAGVDNPSLQARAEALPERDTA